MFHAKEDRLMQSTAATVDEYMQTVPPERRAALTTLRRLCREILTGYDESMQYGMPSYSRNGVVDVAFNSQKNYISLYVKQALVDQYRDRFKNVGKGCIRYTKPEQIDFAIVTKLLEGTAALRP
jgi:uncharacterized protein YdhG (YjbR/CyaY superfamily)